MASVPAGTCPELRPSGRMPVPLLLVHTLGPQVDRSDLVQPGGCGQTWHLEPGRLEFIMCFQRFMTYPEAPRVNKFMRALSAHEA